MNFLICSVENAYYFVILPTDSRGFEVDGGRGVDNALAAVVRASLDRNLIYLRSPGVGGVHYNLASIILALLQEHLVMPSTLQVHLRLLPNLIINQLTTPSSSCLPLLGGLPTFWSYKLALL